MTNETKRRFLHEIAALSELPPGAHVDSATHALSRIRTALLEFGSETPGNVSCARCLEVGRFDSGVGPQWSLAVGSGDDRVAISELLNHAEGNEPPSGVKKAFPTLPQEGWDTVLRLATLVFCALEGKA